MGVSLDGSRLDPRGLWFDGGHQIIDRRQPNGRRVIGTFHVPAHPGASGVAVSARMSVARRRDTAPEMLLRRELHRRGRRYRVVAKVPGNNRRTIDIAFTRQRLAVFVDGCFWHSCPEHGTQPSANSAWWTTKLKANRDRDADTDRLLADAGWRVLRIWEHESAAAAADRVEEALREGGRS